MVRTLTANNVRFDDDPPVAASGTWQYNAPVYGPLGWFNPQGVLRNAGVALVLAISPANYGTGPWFTDRRKESAGTLGSVSRSLVRRQITILEARRIALEVLARAEHQRVRFGEEEAHRGIDWEQQL
jgi:hypothetical protein